MPFMAGKPLSLCLRLFVAALVAGTRCRLVGRLFQVEFGERRSEKGQGSPRQAAVRLRRGPSKPIAGKRWSTLQHRRYMAPSDLPR